MEILRVTSLCYVGILRLLGLEVLLGSVVLLLELEVQLGFLGLVLGFQCNKRVTSFLFVFLEKSAAAAETKALV